MSTLETEHYHFQTHQVVHQLETPQRLAEALPDDSGGSADGRAWFKDNRAKIAVERAKLA